GKRRGRGLFDQDLRAVRSHRFDGAGVRVRPELPVVAEDDLRHTPRRGLDLDRGEIPDSPAARTNMAPEQQFHDVSPPSRQKIWKSGDPVKWHRAASNRAWRMVLRGGNRFIHN